MDGFIFLLILAIEAILLAIKTEKIFRRKRRKRKGKRKRRKNVHN
ncbi:MAG TPA: hypothetical protein VHT73_17280 [Thermodesulfobacteriota bacterium]|nr:hypothetical protein [Thermodesulfobacteriota bacterium]